MMGLYAEKVSATAKLTIVYEVVIYEIRITLTRLSPGDLMVQDRSGDNSLTLLA